MEREQVAEVTSTNKDQSAQGPTKRESEKIYPNSPCPCGSGKKYKNCCGRAQFKNKVVTSVVELDQMKQELQTYETPLAEVRDSL